MLMEPLGDGDVSPTCFLKEAFDSRVEASSPVTLTPRDRGGWRQPRHHPVLVVVWKCASQAWTSFSQLPSVSLKLRAAQLMSALKC